MLHAPASATGDIGAAPSRYNIRVPLKNGRELLYNSLSRATCILEPADVALLDRCGLMALAEARGNETLSGLLDNGFVLPTTVDERQVIKDLYWQNRDHKTSITLTICPTLFCNFGCDYCFQGVEKPTGALANDVCDGICALYERILDEQPETQFVQIMWYGGEPLVSKGIIFSLSERLNEITRRRNRNSSAAMVSNGYMLDRPTAQRLYDLGLRMVQITLDGAQDAHDQRRALLSKRGTYEKIVSNMRSWIDDIGITVNLRVNVDERNREGITLLIDDLAERGFGQRPNFKMYFAPVESVTKGCHNVADKMLIKREYGGLEADYYVQAFRKGLADLPYPAYFIGICQALRQNDFIVVPCGDVHKCWDTVSFPEHKIGSVFELDQLFTKGSVQQNMWSAFDPLSHSTCSSCKILPNCAGFCAHKFLNSAEVVGEASLPCPSLKYSINEKLVHMAVARGLLSEEDYDPEAIRTNPYDICDEVFDAAHYADQYHQGEAAVAE
jgi:uncharacterized protein